MTTRLRLALRLALVLTLTVVLVAPTATANPPDGPHYVWSQTPSKVWLQRPDDTFLRLRAWTYCWTAPPHGGTQSGACADGFPPDPGQLRRLTTGGSPRFWFGRPGWRFSAHLTSIRTPDDTSCEGRARVTRKQPRWFRIARPERPGIYQVDLFGRGPEGDEALTFRWRVGRYVSPAAC